MVYTTLTLCVLAAVVLTTVCDARPRPRSRYARNTLKNPHRKNALQSSLLLRQYTGNFCSSDTDCVSPRLCYSLENSPQFCAAGESDCFCASISHISCTTSEDCLPNDRCVETSNGSDLCFACNLFDSIPSENVTLIDEGNCDSSREPTATSPPSNTSTLAPSSSLPPAQSTPPPPSQTPVGSPIQSSAPTPESAQSPSSPSTTDPPSASNRPARSDPFPTQTPAGSPIAKVGICIAVDMLSHMDSSSLIFGTHMRAAVLCDQYASCATPGHMLLFRANPMSMNEYCALPDVSCVKRVKLVNSPRMKIGLRVSSRSPAMQFTALAATKETWLETAALRLLLKIGAWYGSF